MPNAFVTASAGVVITALALLATPFAANAQYVLVPGRNGVEHLRSVRNRSTANRNRTANAARRNTTRTSSTPKKHKLDLTEALAQINLTPAQRSQIDSFQAKSDKDGRAIYDDKSLTGQQVIDKMQATNHTMLTNIVGTLTPEQKTKLGTLYPEAKGI